MKIKTTLFAIFFVSQLLLTNGVIVDLKLDNFKQNFGCDLQDYLSCKNTPKRDWLIMFMAPWCGHCKQAKPVFQNFATSYKTQLIKNHQDEIGQLIDSSLQIAVVDCTQNRQLCNYFNTKGFPTFIYLTADKKGIQYLGPRTVEGFKNFTQYHDPDQNHLYCKYIEVSHSYWNDFKQHFVPSVKQYWVELIVFSLIIPSILGYFLGKWFYGKRNKGTSKQNITSPISEQAKQTSNENQKKNQ